MFKIFFLCNLIFFFTCFDHFIRTDAFGASPELGTERVVVRAGKHPDFIRIVFTLSEDTFKKSTVITTDEKLIKVNFVHPVTLISSQQETEKIITKGEGFFEIIKGIKVMAGSNFCLIQLEKFNNFKLSRLNAPPRIVIDAYHSSETLLKQAPLKPALQQTEATIKKTFGSFFIDAGHGGYDKGIYDENNSEKDTTLKISKEMAQILISKGKKAMLTRKADQRLSIRERIALANTQAHDIFLSIHISASDECIIYTYAPKVENPSDTGKTKISEEIAGNLMNTLRKDFTFKIRHEKLPLPILKSVPAPALLIELPHFTNFSYDQKNRDLLIKAIIKGLVVPQLN